MNEPTSRRAPRRRPGQATPALAEAVATPYTAALAGDDPPPGEIAPLLLPWYRRHGRVLPWRDCGDPYRIWVSEIMLQQTRVDTVLRYYSRFLARFPDPAALAAASEEEVRTAWAGLGFYRRVLNLHRAARQVVAEHGGVVPRDPALLGALPGIGRYTVGAILSAAWDDRLPILDGNVERVLCRLYRIAGDPQRSEIRRRLWALAEALLPAVRGAGDVNQALMDLGATVCQPHGPACDRCPLAPLCLGHRGGDPERFPTPARRVEVLLVDRVALVVRRGGDGAVLLVQRPADGLLAGMWEPPARDLQPGDQQAAVALALAQSCRCGPPAPRGVAEHLFSHRRWRVQVYLATADELTGWDAGPAQWSTPERLAELAVPTATHRILAAADREPDGQQGTLSF